MRPKETQKSGRQQTTVFMDAAAWRRVRRIALDRGCSAADLVNEAVAQWLQRDGGAADGGAAKEGEQA
jgi:hypothetical protein